MFKKVLPVLLALISLFYMLHATDVYRKNIGLTHDTLWDFSPAVGILNGDSLMRAYEIRILGYPLPLVSGPYSGALKIWILAPLLALCGTSALMDLVLNVIFGFAYLLALYWALLPAAGGKWASLVFLIPLVDTNYLLTVPMDSGIFLFQYIFISLTIGAIFRYLSTSQLKYYWLAWFFNGCLLAQKLTAIPIVISIAGISGILSLRQFLRVARTESQARALTGFIAIPAAVFLIPLVPHLYYFSQSGIGDLFAKTAEGRRLPYFIALKMLFKFSTSMFDGADWYRRITLDYASYKPAPSLLAILGLAAIAASLLVRIVSGRKEISGKYLMACLCMGAGSILLYPAFPGLERPWHYYVLGSIFFPCVVLATRHLVSNLALRSGRYATSVPAAFVVFMTWGGISGVAHGIRFLRRIEAVKGTCVTSPALNDAYADIVSSKTRVVYAINYSLANPIYVFSKGSVHTEDLAWTDLTTEKIEGLLEKVKRNPEAAIAYRFCSDKTVESAWIGWLNREPQIFDLIKRLKLEGDKVSETRHYDNRQTEFVLVRHR